MKNVLSYFYNMEASNIKKIGNNYHFNYNYKNYIFFYYNMDINIEETYKMSIFLINNNIKVHKMILNINNLLITEHNNKQYILLYPYEENHLINYQDIEIFNNIIVSKSKITWYKLWCEKIDYIEYQIKQFKTKYKILYESVDYHIGLTENAISLLSNFNEEVNISISHRRINEYSYDFYNPLNLIYDTKVRDIAEYYKKNTESIDLNQIIKYLNSNEIYLFFIRILFPTDYFDCYEDIISERIHENKIKKVINNITFNEKYIKDIYILISNYINIP